MKDKLWPGNMLDVDSIDMLLIESTLNEHLPFLKRN